MKTLVYYKIDMTLASPLAIGSGANSNTDKDVIVDAAGIPFIPATAVAGVMRSYIEKKHPGLEKDIFGEIGTDAKKSKVRVYDALYAGDKKGFFITTRDCVKLSEKVAVKGAKFDMEAVETGASFTGYIELISEDAAPYIEEALAALHNQVTGFGSKTSRGYGKVRLEVSKRSFSDADTWLDFDMFDSACWDCDKAEKVELKADSMRFSLTVSLRLTGGISIREYTTQISPDGKTMPDYKSMSLHSVIVNGDTAPVIPGTSWAGAFRDRFSEYSDSQTVRNIFGYVDEKTKETQKSAIAFSESVLSGGTYKISTRNSIDRFSGATKDTALYTEKTYFHGDTQLTLTMREKPSNSVIYALGACLADLHNGFLAVGGLTSVGRGLFEITSLEFNGKALTAENITNGRINRFVEEVSGI